MDGPHVFSKDSASMSITRSTISCGKLRILSEMGDMSAVGGGGGGCVCGGCGEWFENGPLKYVLKNTNLLGLPWQVSRVTVVV